MLLYKEMEAYQEDRLKAKYQAISLAVIMVTAFVLAQPMQMSRAEVSEQTHQFLPFKSCYTDINGLNGDLVTNPTLPDDLDAGKVVIPRTSMETVVSGDVAKTVHIEKEVYKCSFVQNNNFVKFEATIYTEIFENMTSKEFISGGHEVVYCAIDYSTGSVLQCASEKPPQVADRFGPCKLKVNHDPLLNVVQRNKIVKSIEANKEVWLCAGNDNVFGTDDDKKLDVILFTDVWEDLKRVKSGDTVLKKEFLEAACLTFLDRALVEFCTSFLRL